MKLTTLPGPLKFHDDCREFRSDRPCVPHKATGQQCDGCQLYAPYKENILILKFDALGDVLRSSAILHGIRAKYPSARITWFMKQYCKDLFLNNPNVDEVLVLEDAAAQWRLNSQTFDIVYSLDPSRLSASIVKSLNAKQVVGFTVNQFGSTIPSDSAAEEWYRMGLDDGLKRVNTRTFFDHLYQIAHLEHQPEYLPQLFFSESETKQAAATVHDLGIDPLKPVIGLNPGAGGRWRYKRWNEEHFAALIDTLHEDQNLQLLLLGGMEDLSVLQHIHSLIKSPSRLIVPKTGTLRHFMQLISLTDILVCGDTLALHIAVALQKYVVALFGPTSAAEIDLFGRGEKVVAQIGCQGCYLSDCDVRPTCMDIIPPSEILAAVHRGLKQRNTISHSKDSSLQQRTREG